MTLIDPPDVLEQGRVGKSPIARVGGTGSISTLGIPEDEAKAAEARRAPIGFRAPPVDPHYRSFAEAVDQVVQAQLHAGSAAVERELRDLGECLWTARDTITIYSDALGARVVHG